MWDVHYTNIAEQDLQSIYDYISDVILEPGTAEKQTDRIMDAADSLGQMPFRHRMCDYEPWRSRGWRVMPVDKYLVFYLPYESQGIVAIMRIIYGGRDIEKHLDKILLV